MGKSYSSDLRERISAHGPIERRPGHESGAERQNLYASMQYRDSRVIDTAMDIEGRPDRRGGAILRSYREWPVLVGRHREKRFARQQPYHARLLAKRHLNGAGTRKRDVRAIG